MGIFLLLVMHLFPLLEVDHLGIRIIIIYQIQLGCSVADSMIVAAFLFAFTVIVHAPVPVFAAVSQSFHFLGSLVPYQLGETGARFFDSS